MTNDELRAIIKNDLSEANAAQIKALISLGWECTVNDTGTWTFIKFIEGDKYIAHIIPQGFEVSVGERRDFMHA